MAPNPLHPVLTDAGDTWKYTANIMKWFVKLVTSGYGWSDLIIKLRQDKANERYKIEKAEKEAAKIMKGQEKRQKELNAKSAARKRLLSSRSYDFEDEGKVAEDMDEFIQFLEDHVDEFPFE
jgi:hypothetical protein